MMLSIQAENETLLVEATSDGYHKLQSYPRGVYGWFRKLLRWPSATRYGYLVSFEPGDLTFVTKGDSDSVTIEIETRSTSN